MRGSHEAGTHIYATFAMLLKQHSNKQGSNKGCTESAVSSDTYIGGKHVEEISQEIEMGGECGWHLANVCNCGTWKNPQYE